MIVLGEIRDGELRNVTFEALAAGRTISGDGEVIGVLIGENVQSVAQELIHYGADKVLTAEDPKLKAYTADGYSQVMRAIIDQENPIQSYAGTRQWAKTFHRSSRPGCKQA